MTKSLRTNVDGSKAYSRLSTSERLAAIQEQIEKSKIKGKHLFHLSPDHLHNYMQHLLRLNRSLVARCGQPMTTQRPNLNMIPSSNQYLEKTWGYWGRLMQDVVEGNIHDFYPYPFPGLLRPAPSPNEILSLRNTRRTLIAKLSRSGTPSLTNLILDKTAEDIPIPVGYKVEATPSFMSKYVDTDDWPYWLGPKINLLRINDYQINGDSRMTSFNSIPPQTQEMVKFIDNQVMKPIAQKYKLADSRKKQRLLKTAYKWVQIMRDVYDLSDLEDHLIVQGRDIIDHFLQQNPNLPDEKFVDLIFETHRFLKNAQELRRLFEGGANPEEIGSAELGSSHIHAWKIGIDNTYPSELIASTRSVGIYAGSIMMPGEGTALLLVMEMMSNAIQLDGNHRIFAIHLAKSLLYLHENLGENIEKLRWGSNENIDDRLKDLITRYFNRDGPAILNQKPNGALRWGLYQSLRYFFARSPYHLLTKEQQAESTPDNEKKYQKQVRDRIFTALKNRTFQQINTVPTVFNHPAYVVPIEDAGKYFLDGYLSVAMFYMWKEMMDANLSRIYDITLADKANMTGADQNIGINVDTAAMYAAANP